MDDPIVLYTSVAKRSSERHLLLVPQWSYGSDGAGDEDPQELEEYVPPVSRLFSFFRELLSLKKWAGFRIVICCFGMMMVDEGQLSALGPGK